MKGTEDGCTLTAQENRVIQIYRDPVGWLRELTPAERKAVWSFVFGEVGVIPECLSEALGHKRQSSRSIIAPQRLYQPVLVSA